MKKIFIIVCAILITQVSLAEEAIQEVENNQTYFTSNISKTPEASSSKHKIVNHFSFFTSNVIVNGKTQLIIPTDAQLKELRTILKDRI